MAVVYNQTGNVLVPVNTTNGQVMPPGTPAVAGTTDAKGNAVASTATQPASTVITPPAAPKLNLAPTFASTALGGVPQLNAATSAPTSYQASTQGYQNPTVAQNQGASNLINAPTVGTTNAQTGGTVNAQNVNTATSNQDLSNNALASQINAGLQPSFTAQNRALTEADANAGIVGGSAIGAQEAQNAAQQSQLTAALAPLDLQQEGLAQTQTLANTAAQNQGNQINSAQNLAAQNTNVGNQQAVNLINANAANQTGQFNATNNMAAQGQNVGNTNTINASNTAAQNQAQATTAAANNTMNAANMAATNQARATNAAAALQNNQYNATAQNETGQYNTGNLINMANSNATAANTATTNAANLENQDYLAQLQSSTDIQTNDSSAPASNYVFQQSQPAQVNLGTLPGLSSPPTITPGNPAPAAPAASAPAPAPAAPLSVPSADTYLNSQPSP